MIYLVEHTGYNPVNGQEETCRWCTGRGYMDDSGNLYAPRVKQAGSLKWDMFQQGKTFGYSDMGFGEIVLINSDGDLDNLKNWGFDSRDVTVKIGEQTDSYASFETLYKATIQQAVCERDQVSLRIKSKSIKVTKNIQPVKFLGNNSLPDGVEGVEDLKDRPKPLLLGKVFNATPICVNTSKLIYQLHYGAPGGVDSAADWDAITDFDAYTGDTASIAGITLVGVYDRGAELTRDGSDYSDITDLLSNAPTNDYKVLVDQGLIRLKNSPSGVITATGQNNSLLDPTVGNVMRDILIAQLKVFDSEIVQDDIDTLNTLNSDDAGIFITEEMSGKDALDKVAQSLSVWHGYDRLGYYRMFAAQLPSATAQATLTLEDLIDFQPLPDGDAENGVPLEQVFMHYKKNYTVIEDSSMAGVVSDADRAILTKEDQVVQAENPSILVQHPLATNITIETAFFESPDVECARILSLYGSRRDRMSITVMLTKDNHGFLDLYSTVIIQIPRFGFDFGKLFAIIGFDLDCSKNKVTLFLWG
jgi:hypothetical protein